MKKFFYPLVAIFMLVAFALWGCKKDEIEKESPPKTTAITLSERSPIEILIGSPKTITLSGGDGKNYTAEISDPAKASVAVESKTLTITPLSVGKITIKIKSADKVAELLVTIIAPQITFSEASPVEVAIDSPKKITLGGGDGKNYTAEVSDPTKATVSVQGNVLTITPLSHGEVTIQIKSADKTVTLSANVNVPEITLSETTPIQIRTLETKTITLSGGNASYTLENANPETVQATLQGNSLTLVGLQQGQAQLTLTSAGRQVTIAVNVVFASVDFNVVSDLEGNVIFKSTYRFGQAGVKMAYYESRSLARTGKMLVVNFIDKPNVGDQVELTIHNSRGLPNDLTAGKLIKGKVIGVKADAFQLQTEKYILMIGHKI